MSQDQITGILRAILTFAGGILVSNGWDESTVTWGIGAILTVGGAIWSVLNNRPGKVIKSVT